MATLDDVMSKATPAERTVNVCVAGDLVNEYERLREQLANSSDSPGRLSGNTATAEIERRIKEISGLMQEATFTFRFRSLSPKKWSDLITAHADPTGNRLFNPETFPTAAIGACCIEPEGMDDPEALELFIDSISPAQHSELFNAAWSVNVDSPKGLT